MVIVSTCLLGIRCRYDGKILHLEKENQKFINQLIKKEIVIPVCPEQLGGLSTPRSAAEIKNDRVVSADGVDVTKNFQDGAREVIKICTLFKIKTAYLKNRGPSCGKHGITTKYLKKAKIKLHFIQ